MLPAVCPHRRLDRWRERRDGRVAVGTADAQPGDELHRRGRVCIRSGEPDECGDREPPAHVQRIAGAAGTYFVRVRAHGHDGHVSAASNEVMINVGGGPVVCSGANMPVPVLGFLVERSSVTLTWQMAGGAPSFAIEAGSFAGAANLVNFETLELRDILHSSQRRDWDYFVRVRAKSACGAASAPSNEVVIAVGH